MRPGVLMVLLALALLACSSPPDFEPPRRVFVESAELEGPTDKALDRWSSATGVYWYRVELRSDAHLVVSRADLPDGRQGVHSSREIIVSPGLEGDTLDRVLAHEFGHALGAEHIDSVGVMRPTVDDANQCITAADLRTACMEFACPTFEPECLASEVQQ